MTCRPFRVIQSRYVVIYVWSYENGAKEFYFVISHRSHSRPQRPRSYWSAPRIATSGQLQRHSGFEWICKHNRLRSEPIRFVRLDSEHAQSDGKSVNRGLPLLDLARGSQRSNECACLSHTRAIESAWEWIAPFL